jgi:hypothetical protein
MPSSMVSPRIYLGERETVTLADSRGTDRAGSISYWSDFLYFELLAGVTLGMRQLRIGALVL